MKITTESTVNPEYFVHQNFVHISPQILSTHVVCVCVCVCVCVRVCTCVCCMVQMSTLLVCILVDWRLGKKYMKIKFLQNILNLQYPFSIALTINFQLVNNC